VSAPRRIPITDRRNDAVLIDTEADSLRHAVEAAVEVGADLSYASLTGADLRNADLRWAKLAGAKLEGAKLAGAYLRWANLYGTDISRADLTAIRDDIGAVLDAAAAEVPALLAALREGRVDGSTYEGACACLVGTIAHAGGVDRNSLGTITPDPSRPAERWFVALRPGDKPDRSQVAAITVEWIEQWMARAATTASAVSTESPLAR